MDENRIRRTLTCAAAIGAITVTVGCTAFLGGAADAVVPAGGAMHGPTIAGLGAALGATVTSTAGPLGSVTGTLGSAAASTVASIGGGTVSGATPALPVTIPVTIMTGDLGPVTVDAGVLGTATTSSSTTTNGSSPTTGTSSTGGSDTGSSTTGNSSTSGSTIGGSAPGGGSTTTGSTSTAPSVARLGQVVLQRSAASVYPVKDGYRDTVVFAVRALDTAGAPIAVHGTAWVERGGSHVADLTIDGPVGTLTWNGRSSGTVVVGLFTFRFAVQDSSGTAASGSTTASVVNKRLVATSLTRRVSTAAVQHGVALPATVRKALGFGAVSVKATVRATHSAFHLAVTRTGATRSVLVRSGTTTTRAVSIPTTAKHVHVMVKQPRGAKPLGTVKLVYRFRVLR